jgi:hypothetical protein
MDLGRYHNNWQTFKKILLAIIKFILKLHSISICGRKDELVLRLYLLKHGRAHLSSHKQEQLMKDHIRHAKTIISEQIKSHLLAFDDVRRVRTHGSEIKNKSAIPIPEIVESISDLQLVFNPMKECLSIKRRKSTIAESTIEGHSNKESEVDTAYEAFFEIGSRV